MNYKSLFLFALLFFLYLDIYSTHIRAGEIVARRISTTSLTYEFTVIGYTDTGSEVEFGGGEFSFGDGNFVEILDEQAISSQKILLDNQVALNLFKVVHTFQAPGRYVVSYFEQNRNYFMNLAKSKGFTVIDLTNAFQQSFNQDGKYLDFKVINDGHWNQRGHALVSKELVKAIYAAENKLNSNQF